MSTLSPRCSRPRAISARHAVRKPSGAAAARSNGIVLRDRVQVPRRRRHVLREAALRVLAQDPVLDAQRLLPRTAPLAVGRTRATGSTTTRCPTSKPSVSRRARALDHAGDVRPADVRHRRLDRQPAPDPEVQVVHRARRAPRISTSPGPGSGRGTSSMRTTSGPPVSWKTRMLSLGLRADYCGAGGPARAHSTTPCTSRRTTSPETCRR